MTTDNPLPQTGRAVGPGRLIHPPGSRAKTPEASLVRLCTRLGLVKPAKGRYYVRQHGGQCWFDPGIPLDHPDAVRAVAAWLNEAVDLDAAAATVEQARSLLVRPGVCDHRANATQRRRAAAEVVRRVLGLPNPNPNNEK